MATSGSAVGPTQEFIVRAPRNTGKKVSIMKFSRSNKVDFAKCGPVKIERENNLRQYKASHDLDMMPKFGAGSEFGREQKEEARRKKYGVMLKRYNPEDQPWILKTGQGKETRRFKGTREGGIGENTSYYLFTQCPDGAFEAVPVNDWYSFTPVINYRHLTMEEAEEEFERRDKTLNYFSIMVKKRLKNEEDADVDLDEGEVEGKKKKESKKKGFMLMDKDDWTDDEEDDDDDDEDEKDDEGRPKKNDKKGKKSSGKPVKNSKKNDDDEAIEESDEGDYDDKEVDYITESESTDDSDLDIHGSKYREQGVVDEDGLRRLNESGESEDEEEEKKPEEETPSDEKKEKSKEGGSDSESSSESSDSDDSDDLEEDSRFLFMGGPKPKKEPKKEKKEKGSGSGANSASTSRSSTPTAGVALEEENAKKRKLDSDSPHLAKKAKVDASLHPSASAPSLSSMQSSMGITEDNIRRYLTRKPMTTKDLLQKFKSKQPGESKEQLVTTVAQLLKKINPEKTVIKGKMYLYLKKPE